MRTSTVAVALAATCIVLACGGGGGSDGSGDTACATGTKSCGSTCALLTDPAFGCAAEGCAPCAPRNPNQLAPTCVDGQCSFQACTPNETADCNKDVSDLCETAIATDVRNCGACGNACPTYVSGPPACTAGLCVDPGCKTDFGDCNAKADDGCETRISGADARNCGACGHDCRGATTCGGGLCAPVVLAPGEDEPFGVAVDGPTVFFTTGDGGVKKVAAAGGVVAPLAVAQNVPRGLAVDATNVYFAAEGRSGADGAILKVGRNGTCVPAAPCPTVLAPARKNPRALVADGSTIYFIESGALGDGAVTKVGKDGAGLTPLASLLTRPTGIAIDPTTVYFTVPGAVMKVNKDGTGLGTLASTTECKGIAVDATYVYFASNIRIERMKKDGSERKAIAIAKAPVGLLVDGDSVYFTQFDKLFKSPADGVCRGPCPQLLATGVFSGIVDDTSSLAVDGSYLYFALASAVGGAVERVAK